jgi:hypothetical protein
MVWVRGLVRLAGISRAGINPISAQIRFLVIKLALNSLIRKVKESTEVFQIPPPRLARMAGGPYPPFNKRGELNEIT